jgi:hypothetical protein
MITVQVVVPVKHFHAQQAEVRVKHFHAQQTESSVKHFHDNKQKVWKGQVAIYDYGTTGSSSTSKTLSCTISKKFGKVYIYANDYRTFTSFLCARDILRAK